MSFFRLPWVSWTAPKAMQTDMGGPSLLGLFTALGTAGSPKTRVLRGTPQAGTPLGDVQTVTPEQAHAAAQKFLSS